MFKRLTRIIFANVIIALIIFSCKEEIVIEQNLNKKMLEKSTIKPPTDQMSVQIDTLLAKDKKIKIQKLKARHEEPYVVIEKPEYLLKLKLQSRNITKSSYKAPNISVQSGQCDYMSIDVWALEKYHSRSGYNVGICTKSTWQYNSTKLTSLKNDYAFNLILLPLGAFVNPIVYPDNQIVAGIDFRYPTGALNSYRNFLSQPGRQQFFGIYSDEPWHSILPGIRDSIAKTINDLKNIAGFTNSIYMAGETCDTWADRFDDLVDVVNLTAYTDMSFTEGIGCWRAGIPGTNVYFDEVDQRDEWTSFNNLFGSKFNHLWISGELDRGEMDQLMGHAKNMYKNSIWLYAGQDYISDQEYMYAINEFDYYAYIHGFNKREERKFIYVYYYIGFGDPCSDAQITSWELVDILDTGETVIRQY